ncbi:hypothetical protein AX16_007614 [Volvariella volvacea WC 439]|nr:hypothetical protein AX16_007614 [Volvariella volvacea WC 439]
MPTPAPESFPDEILLLIHDLLEPTSYSEPSYRNVIKNLRLVSHRFNNFFIQFLIQDLSLSWISQDLYDGPYNLNCTFGESQRPPFEPTPDALIPSIFRIYVTFHMDHLVSLCATKAPQGVITRFSPFWEEIARLASLSHLHVMWKDDEEKRDERVDSECCSQPLEMLFQVVKDATSGGLHLLDIQFPHWTSVYEPLPQFLASNSIKELYLSGFCSGVCSEARCHENASSFRVMLGKIFYSAPNVREVHLARGCTLSICPLEELLPSGLNEILLESLKIYGNIVVRQPLTGTDTPIGISTPFRLPLMKNLRQLELEVPLPPADLDEFWVALCTSGARLSHLDLRCGVSVSLLEYLASYQGLEDLRLRVNHAINTPPTSTLFSDSVLPAHASTLTALEIHCLTAFTHPGFESLTFNLQTWLPPSRFPNLAELDVHLPHDWLRATSAFGTYTTWAHSKRSIAGSDIRNRAWVVDNKLDIKCSCGEVFKGVCGMERWAR